MIDKIKEHISEVEAFATQSKEELESFRIKYLGKKGLLNEFFASFKEIAKEEKKEFGQVVNRLKNAAEEKVKNLRDEIESKEEVKGNYGDLTRPGEPIHLGSRHPISIVKNKIIDVFSRVGFNVSEGPEIEDDWHNLPL